MTRGTPRSQEAREATNLPAESEAILRLDRTALRLKSALDRTAVPLAHAARAFCERRGWTPFGNACLDDHATERFARSGRWIRDLAELGRGLERLPGLAAALTGQDGGRPIGRAAAKLVAGVADTASLALWIHLARTVSVRQLRRQVARARAAESATPVPDAPDPDNTSNAAKLNKPGGEPADGQTVVGKAGAVESSDLRSDDDSPERVLVRFPVPSSVQAAFEDALHLHRAVSGSESTVTSFVEALVAEAQAGPAPPDIDATPLRHGPGAAAIEACLERAAAAWRHLGGPDAEPATDEVSRECLARLEALSRVAGKGGARDLDGQIGELIGLEGRIRRRLGEVLARMVDRGACPRLMFRGLGHYAEERLGLGRSAAQERARVVRRLRRFPLLRAAYNAARLPLRAVAIVLRVFDRLDVPPEVESAWVAHAGQVCIKRLLDEERALRRSRLLQPAACCPLPLDDAAWHASLDQRPGSLYCRVAEAGLVAAAGRSPEMTLRLRLPVDLADRLLATIEGHRAALARRVEDVPWDEPWPDPLAAPSILAARTFSTRCRRAPAWVGLLGLLEDFVATWDPPQGGVRRRSDALYSRDGWRCMAPGCTARRNLEDHHLDYRSRGGDNALTNRICLCRFHHRQGEHGLLATIRGVAPLGVTFALGRPDLVRCFRNERRLDRDSAVESAA